MSHTHAIPLVGNDADDEYHFDDDISDSFWEEVDEIVRHELNGAGGE